MKFLTSALLATLTAQLASALDYNDNVFNDLKFTTNYAKVAYCSVLNPSFLVGELEDACPRMDFCTKQTGTDIVAVIKPCLLELEISGDAYVAANHDDKQVIVSFRGSMSAGDWITDFAFAYCPYAPILQNQNINASLFEDVTNKNDSEMVSQRIYDNADKIPCEDCYVHCGVYVALTQFLEEAEAAAKPYIEQGYELVVTGHSLGGGYAAMGGFEFLQAGYKPKVIAYSGLRVGNPAYNNYVDDNFDTENSANIVAGGGDLPIPSFSRLYQQTDIVPRLPPGPGYTHAGLNFEITKFLIPHEKQNVEFLGATNNDENSAYEFDLSDPLSLLVVYQHIYLFQRVSWPCNDFLSKRDENFSHELSKRGFNESDFTSLVEHSYDPMYIL